MVTAPLKEGVIQVAEMGDYTLLLAHSQHAEVPFPKPITARHSLPTGMAMQDVVIALQEQLS